MSSKNNKGLGKGLGAIFTDYEDQQTATEEAVSAVELGEIRPNPYQPRKTFDEAALNELSDSIKKNGVIQPIILRKTVSGYEILAGERRFRAAQLAQLPTIPAIIRTVNDETMMEVAVLENLQREDLNPLEEAQAYDTLMTRLHLTQAQVATRLGKSRPYIANYLRLLTLPKKVQKMVQNRELSMGQARTLLGLKDKKQLEALAKQAKDESLTVRQLEKLVAKANETTPKKTKSAAAKSPFIMASENQLGDKFGTQVKINERNKNQGKIEINYLSMQDLNRILELLNISLD